MLCAFRTEDNLISIRTEWVKTGDYSDALLLASWSSWHAHFAYHIFLGLFGLQDSLATSSLALLFVFASSIFWGCIVDFDFGEFVWQVFFKPCFALFVLWIIFAVLNKGTMSMNIQWIPEQVLIFTSIGIVQLPQYCTVNGYVIDGFGPITKCSNACAIVANKFLQIYLNKNDLC